MKLKFSMSFFFFFALHSSLVGNSGRLTWVRLQQPKEQGYLHLLVRAVFSCIQTKVWLPMLGIFNVRTDVNACDCTRGLHGHRKRVCTESWLCKKKTLLHWGIELVLTSVTARRCSELATVKRGKRWSGYVTRHESLSITILQGILEGWRRSGRQRKCWMDNTKERTSPPVPELLTVAPRRQEWKRISVKLSFMSARRPNRSKNWTELNWCKVWLTVYDTGHFILEEDWNKWINRDGRN